MDLSQFKDCHCDLNNILPEAEKIALVKHLRNALGELRIKSEVKNCKIGRANNFKNNVMFIESVTVFN